MSNNLHNDHFTSQGVIRGSWWSHELICRRKWRHCIISSVCVYEYNFPLMTRLVGAGEEQAKYVEQQWSVYLRNVCVSAEQCTVGDEGVTVDLSSRPDRVDKYQVSNLQPCTSHRAHAHLRCKSAPHTSASWASHSPTQPNWGLECCLCIHQYIKCAVVYSRCHSQCTLLYCTVQCTICQFCLPWAIHYMSILSQVYRPHNAHIRFGFVASPTVQCNVAAAARPHQSPSSPGQYSSLYPGHPPLISRHNTAALYDEDRGSIWYNYPPAAVIHRSRYDNNRQLNRTRIPRH